VTQENVSGTGRGFKFPQPISGSVEVVPGVSPEELVLQIGRVLVRNPDGPFNQLVRAHPEFADVFKGRENFIWIEREGIGLADGEGGRNDCGREEEGIDGALPRIWVFLGFNDGSQSVEIFLGENWSLIMGVGLPIVLSGGRVLE